MAVTHVQEAARGAELSLGCQLQQQGTAMLGKTVWLLWPQDQQWYSARITHYYSETGKFR